LQYNPTGINRIAEAMHRIGMPEPPPPPPPSHTVTINGPIRIRPGATCNWQAAVTGGSLPYTYQWTIDGLNGGTGYDATGSKQVGNWNSSFRVSVLVTDAGGSSVNQEITVTEDSSSPLCQT